ncbi:MAG: type II toxin-antitoxin system RelE/ParE family toxin [Candidatus Daviesbacteria bacterium]|nr:type II toxin-antitoxin system RelE/ParE family toxin [Candidatus Daviesbacteria bacterium]
MFKLHISTKASKQIKQLKKAYQTEIIDVLSEIKETPLLGKPLSRELNKKFSYRFGVYRIIYKVNQQDEIVEILSAGHRSKIYN